MSNDLISQNALREAAEAMHMDLGDLNDLPSELANTFANIYYRFFAYQEHMFSGSRSQLLNPYMPQSSNMLDAYKNLNEFQAQTLSTFKLAKDIVQSIRQVRMERPELFLYVVTQTLDIYKYNIENTGSKSPIRRAIERKFKKVYEIPNLFGIMRRQALRASSGELAQALATLKKLDLALVTKAVDSASDEQHKAWRKQPSIAAEITRLSAEKTAELAVKAHSTTGLVLTKDSDALYREARDVYSRITGEGNILGGWSIGELAELKKAFEVFCRLADEQYGKAYLPLSMIYYVYRYYQWCKDDSHYEYEELAHRYAHLAFDWCSTNQHQNDPEIWNDLGTLYWEEETVETNYELAHYWYQKAAISGFTYAQYNLGLMYAEGQGVALDYKTAAEWYRKSAIKGFGNAQYNLGLMYYFGQGVTRDRETAAEWIRKASKQDIARAQDFLGRMYLNGDIGTQDYKAAAEWFQKAAIRGYAESQEVLASMYAKGQGVTQDYKAAAEWYQKAAMQELAKAQYNLGLMYANGQGVAQDYKTAAEWVKKAAQDYVDAKIKLGEMYHNGEGVPQDDEKSAYWYREAAEQNARLRMR